METKRLTNDGDENIEREYEPLVEDIKNLFLKRQAQANSHPPRKLSDEKIAERLTQAKTALQFQIELKEETEIWLGEVWRKNWKPDGQDFLPATSAVVNALPTTFPNFGNLNLTQKCFVLQLVLVSLREWKIQKNQNTAKGTGTTVVRASQDETLKTSQSRPASEDAATRLKNLAQVYPEGATVYELHKKEGFDLAEISKLLDYQEELVKLMFHDVIEEIEDQTSDCSHPVLEVGSP